MLYVHALHPWSPSICAVRLTFRQKIIWELTNIFWWLGGGPPQYILPGWRGVHNGDRTIRNVLETDFPIVIDQLATTSLGYDRWLGYIIWLWYFHRTAIFLVARRQCERQQCRMVHIVLCGHTTTAKIFDENILHRGGTEVSNAASHL